MATKPPGSTDGEATDLARSGMGPQVDAEEEMATLTQKLRAMVVSRKDATVKSPSLGDTGAWKTSELEEAHAIIGRILERRRISQVNSTLLSLLEQASFEVATLRDVLLSPSRDDSSTTAWNFAKSLLTDFAIGVLEYVYLAALATAPQGLLPFGTFDRTAHCLTSGNQTFGVFKPSPDLGVDIAVVTHSRKLICIQVKHGTTVLGYADATKRNKFALQTIRRRLRAGREALYKFFERQNVTLSGYEYHVFAWFGWRPIVDEDPVFLRAPTGGVPIRLYQGRDLRRLVSSVVPDAWLPP